MQRIKHWDQRYSPMALGLCAVQDCNREAADVQRGQPRCSAHLTIEVRMVAPTGKPGQRIGR